MTDTADQTPTRSLHINTERTWRGGEKQTLLLLQGLARRDQHVELIAQPKSPMVDRARESGIKVHEVAMRGEADIFAARSIRGIMKRNDFQICQMHTSHAHTLGAIARGRRRWPRTIVARRVDFSIHRKGMFGLNSIKYRFGIDRYIAISNAIKEVMVRDGIDGDRITVVHSGVSDLPAPRTTAAEIRQRHGIEATVPIIGNVAHLAGHKGQTHLVGAAKFLAESHPDAITLIVGDGSERATIEEEIARHGVGDRVILAGFQEDVSAYLSAFTIFTMPSVQEGLCTSLLDALRCHLPTVASRTGGIPEIIKHEETGLLVEPRDAAGLHTAIARLLDDPGFAKQLASAGNALALGEFSVDHTVERTLRVYRDMIQEESSR